MNKFYRFLLAALNSWFSVIFAVAYVLVSFYLGQHFEDMSIFSASGAVMAIFGLFSMIKFTTIEKFLNQEAIAAANTGVTGPPLSQEESEKLQRENVGRARVRLQKELRSELKGIVLTIIGTLISAYGVYVPIFCVCVCGT